MERYFFVLGLFLCIFVAVPSSGYLKQEECPKKTSKENCRNHILGRVRNESKTFQGNFRWNNL